ncbi:hypothetical protein NKH77_01245 [Streptomyces sp. M19]
MPAMTVLTVLSGLVVLAALGAPPRLFLPLAACAVVVSCVLTGVESALSERPENDPGMVELCLLLVLIVRTARREPFLRAAGIVLVGAAAVVTLPLRVDERSDNLTLLITALTASVPCVVLLGSGCACVTRCASASGRRNSRRNGWNTRGICTTSSPTTSPRSSRGPVRPGSWPAPGSSSRPRTSTGCSARSRRPGRRP